MPIFTVFVNVSVLSIPDYRGGNPYQSNLEAAVPEEITYGCTGTRFPVCRALLSKEITLVHIHWFSAFFEADSPTEKIKRFGMLGLWFLLVRLTSVPIVWTAHNVRIHSTEHPRLEYHLKRWFIKSGMCDRIIVHCESVADELIAELDLPQSVKSRIRIVPHGHYIDNYRNEISQQDARDSLDLPKSSTVFLFFGVMSPYKGLFKLVDAFQELSIPDSRLLLAGKPRSDSFELSLRRTCDGADSIQLSLEFIPDEEIQLYMNAADVVVLPYREITTSGSAVLAMSFGKPLVVPQLGCLPELLSEDGAVLYDPSEPDGLHSALETITQRELESMGSHNMKAVAEYDWEKIGQQTHETYRSVLSDD